MVTVLQTVQHELEKQGVFEGSPNETAKMMVQMLGSDVPYTMALAIANYSMSTFVGHFHYKLDLGEDNKVPMNSIYFVLAKSGAKKTSSTTKCEKAFKLGYNRIQGRRIEKEKLWAEEQGCDMRNINPLSNALATEAGMIQRLNDFKREGIGCPSMYVDEISTELASNADMVPNIKLVAQLFDDGNCKSKPLKDKKMQSEEVVGMGMTALFIGSEHGILEDPAVLTKFETEFISKLARRSFFIYPMFEEEDNILNESEDGMTALQRLLRKRNEGKNQSYEVNKLLNEQSSEVARKAINNDINTIKLSDECQILWDVYSMYCEEMSKLQDKVEAIALEQQHRHWKALKLAGVYAVFNGHTEVLASDLKEAIYVAELTGKDIGIFIEKANREPYEIMLEHFEQKGGELSIHDMVKRKWINKPSDVKTIIELANSKSGSNGMFEQNEEGLVRYTSFKKKEELTCSVMKTDNLQELLDSGISRVTAKNMIASKSHKGFKYVSTTFDKIGTLLCEDRAYSPFKFRDGIRGNDYIEGGANFIVLDIDDTHISDTECSDQLADYRHIIARGSDASNPYKYRVLLPLDVEIKIAMDKWKPFIMKVANHLGLEVDAHGMAQIYFGYKSLRLRRPR